MPEQEAVKGVDFLVDYYGVLGVARDASAEEITKARNTKVRQYHPDRFDGLAPELLNRAMEQMDLVTEAYDTLRDENLKAKYDLQLTEWQGPITKYGEMVIIGAKESAFSFPTLLDNLDTSPEEREASAEAWALQISGFDRATYEFIRGLIESSADIPEGLKFAYAEQLKRFDLYLALREGFMWESLGQRNHSPTPVLDYREKADNELERIRLRASDAVSGNIISLMEEKRLALPAPEGSDDSVEPGSVLAEYNARIDTHFAHQTELLKPIVEEREKVLRARFAIETEVRYHPETSAYTRKVAAELLGGKEDGGSEWFFFTVREDGILNEEIEDIEDLRDPEVATRWIAEGYTILSFKWMQGIDLVSQLEYVLNRHAEKIPKEDATPLAE